MLKKIISLFNNFKNKNKRPKKINSRKKTIKTKKTVKKLQGTIDHVSEQFAYVIIKDRKKDIKVLSSNLMGAFHGDTVSINYHNKNGLGKVVEILKRSRDEFVGRAKKLTINKYIVKLDGRKFCHDVILDNTQKKFKISDGDKIIIKITKWPKNHSLAQGKIKEILGKSGDHNVEMSSIMFEFGLPQDFSKEIQKACKNIDLEIPESEKKRRKDFRDTLTFTIDPENAKDFDDALSIKFLESDTYEIGVHIADPSYYVKKKSILDKEAFKRGNSVYLVDRVIPMLPEILSNNLCSLKPDAERLTLSVIFKINKDGHILDTWLGEGIILSKKRFIYEEAQEIIDSKEGKYYKELDILNNIAKKLRKHRFNKGSIYFSSSEFNIRLDKEGNPINIYKKLQIETNILIEEYMLLANKTISEMISLPKGKKKNLNWPFIYRIHDDPNSDKLEELAKFLKVLNYKFDYKIKKDLFKQFNKLATEFKDKNEFSIVQYFAIRSMAKALYSTECKGHFGLGFQYYTHFTSPIRRYCDLEVHRIIKQFIKNKPIKRDPNYNELSKHISLTERNAIDAERASIKYKQVIFMQSLKKQKLKGMISYIAEKAFFVELLDSGCDGIVSFTDIDGDFYELDKATFSVIGQRHKKKYRIGDYVNVMIKSCDLDKRKAFFVLID